MASLAQGGQDLVFERVGQGKLFYEARLKFAPKSLPRTGLDQGFTVHQTRVKVTPESISSGLAAVYERGQVEFSAGDLVLNDVIVVAPTPRQFVVVEDPLPAGMEAVNQNFVTTSQNLAVGSATPEGFSYAWHSSELRDDRALFFVDTMPAGLYRFRYLSRATTRGSFVVPPTRVEEMYAPEVFGRTGASRVEVQ
jgi:uncharacterized protein YfaS (alpha-2-macroglobulin family)